MKCEAVARLVGGLWCGAAATGVISQDVCVCYIRNMVEKGQERSALKRSALSAFSLRMASPGTKVLLWTDGTAYSSGEEAARLAETVLPTSMRLRLGTRRLFDVVVAVNDSVYGSDMATSLVEAVRQFPESRSGRIARSRVGRLRLVSRPPCELTLFVDDDTYFCAGAQSELASDLIKLRSPVSN